MVAGTETRAQAVLVVGGPGVGKTTLIESGEIARRYGLTAPATVPLRRMLPVVDRDLIVHADLLLPARWSLTRTAWRSRVALPACRWGLPLPGAVVTRLADLERLEPFRRLLTSGDLVGACVVLANPEEVARRLAARIRAESLPRDIVTAAVSRAAHLPEVVGRLTAVLDCAQVPWECVVAEDGEFVGYDRVWVAPLLAGRRPRELARWCVSVEG